MSERILIDSAAAYGLPYVILRYFNVAGADPAGRAGQRTLNATHLVKVAAEAAVGSRDGLFIFGTDYPTPDGTCIRDYIHVSDLAQAHISALNHLVRQGPSLILNCGYGRGYSVREVIAAVEKDVDARLKVTEGPRRPGDAPEVVADVAAIQRVLDWRPRHDDLSVIVSSAIQNERLRIGQ
jgi:UDP-glucose 4-epimerase